MSYGKDVQDELRPHARELRRMIPDVYKGFGALHDAALAEGALDTKTKELIALAIAVSSECDGCIAAHAHAAVRHGASLEEAAETIGVTILMNGGPATIYGPRAFAAFAEFHADQVVAGT
jgi:AhpD family alkylhydroperoxidase